MIPSVIIQFERQPYRFEPGEDAAGSFRLVDVNAEEVNRLEFSILWYTEGKGDEDMGVHFFAPLAAEDGFGSMESASEISDEKKARSYVKRIHDGDELLFRFTAPLPASPLSYYGKILKIHWCARVRLFLKNGREVKSERIFTVGKIPPIQVKLN